MIYYVDAADAFTCSMPYKICVRRVDISRFHMPRFRHTLLPPFLHAMLNMLPLIIGMMLYYCCCCAIWLFLRHYICHAPYSCFHADAYARYGAAACRYGVIDAAIMPRRCVAALPRYYYFRFSTCRQRYMFAFYDECRAMSFYLRAHAYAAAAALARCRVA